MVGINCLGLESEKRCGAEEVLMNLCKGFSENNHESELIFFCYSDMKRRIEKICPRAKYVEFVEKESSHKKIQTMLIQSFSFRKKLRNYKLDTLFFAQAGTGLFKYKLPVVVIPHDIQDVSHPENYSYKKNKVLRRLFFKVFYGLDFRNADKIIAISEVDKKEICQYYSRYRKKVEKIYNPITIPDKIEIVKEKKDYILATNIQYEHKNVITLIKAFKRVKKEFPNIELYLVGRESECTKKLKEYVILNDMDEYVHFTGFISRKELEKLWRETRIYVNPSKFEGFGMTAVESIMYGAPTLLANLEVNREVTENMCHYYGEAEDVEALVTHLRCLLTKTINIDELIRMQSKMIDKYDYKKISEIYWEILKNGVI